MRIQILMLFFMGTFAACSQNPDLGPGYQFEIFKNTPSWELAKAVKREDEKGIIRILKEKKIDINFQEPSFQNTVLHLAIGNDKVLSVKVLLENKANYNITNIDKRAAIHEAVNNLAYRKSGLEILKLLIENGADVNKIRISPNNENDTLGYSVPLKDATNDLACSKLLLEHGANPYFKTVDTYPVWFSMLLSGDINDNIYTAKYMIVDKKMLVPNPISYTVEKKPLDILTLLNDIDLSTDSKRQIAKQEIIDYLRIIDYPKNGVYK